MKNRMLAMVLLIAVGISTAACSTREVLIGTGAAAVGAAAGYYAGDKYDVDVDKEK